MLSRGRLRLAFADGRVEVRTIGIDTDDAGRPSPGKEGILLNDIDYYPPDPD